jgi:hypothetical protein
MHSFSLSQADRNVGRFFELKMTDANLPPVPANRGAQLRQTSSYPGSLIGLLRKQVVLARHVVQVLLDARRLRFSGELAYPRRVSTVVGTLHH